jgi:NAD(P)H dehydrogenase (quinone)
LVGKPATIIFGSGTQSGGQETTALTTLPFLVNQGMVYIPMGCTFGSEFFSLEEIRGGSPYGAGYYSGSDGSRPVSDLEKRIAFHHGRHFATLALKLKK